MSTTALIFLSTVFYLLAASLLGYCLFFARETLGKFRPPTMVLSAIALLLHALVLYHTVFLHDVLDLSFYNAISMMAWVITLIIVLTAITKPLENILVIQMPITAMCLLLETIMPESHNLISSLTNALRVHILFSVFAYSLLSIATVQALVLSFQEHQLHNQQPTLIMHILPPMQVMEDLLIQFLVYGFFLLSLSLATGFMFLHDIFSQHLVHKTTLSILAWVIFGSLLWGRWTFGWRGKKVIHWTLGGFTLLLLAYFGSKLVLELILHRV
ncbi:MAG: hypothetical protein A2W28_09290 [Gammaproteobacteria bacterium RBG_16_51_14]|nr:MAG: hypothetical protein A2W28_09290 [Gammaproteobacteria bacterium RBG_16_51_14]